MVLVASLLLVAGSCSYETQDFDLELPVPPQSTRLLAADGTEIVTLQIPQNRQVVRLDQIPRHVQNAVVAIEDERFWEHSGIDLRGIIRAARRNVSAGGVTEGGSTITQQFVGKLYLDRSEQSARRKFEEMALATQFEDRYTKEFILENYLNWIYLGEGANGVQAAAFTYFGKDVSQLTVAEGALIAGLIQAPSGLNPFASNATAEAALRRRNIVLEKMYAEGYLSEAEYLDALTTPLQLRRRTTVDQRRYPAAHFVDDVQRWFLTAPELNEAFGTDRAARERVLLEGGLRITTTIDLRIQQAAEQAVNDILPAGPDAGVVVLDPDNGAVLAMVGGRDYFGASPAAKVNLANAGGRQTGSSVKPIELAAAFEAGWTPDDTLPAPQTITLQPDGLVQPWTVKGGATGGRTVTLAEATRQSYNTVFAQLAVELGPQAFVDMAKRLGVKAPLEPVHAAVLGTENMSVLDLATAFSTFAARGRQREPMFVSRIAGPDGRILYQHRDTSKRAIEPYIADQVSALLEGAVVEGTGTRARLPDRPVAGKTGTAEDYADATFAGYTRDVVTAVWVGFPEGQVPMRPPTTPIEVFGGSYPAEIFQRVMVVANEGLDPRPFEVATPPTTTLPPPTFEPSTTRSGTVPTVITPAFVGQPLEQARTTAAAIGVTLKVLNVESDQFPAGAVVNQAPRSGTTVVRGTQITIEVSTGPSKVAATVPNVVGLTRAEARSQLVAAGFNVIEIIGDDTSKPAGATPAGIVWRQTPTAGSARPADRTVRIFIGP